MGRKFIDRILIAILLLFLLIPLLGTFLYSFSSEWTFTVLPKALTLEWYKELFADQNFVNAMLRTIFLAAIGTLGSLVLVVPTVFLLYVYYQKYLWVLDMLVLLSFSVPAIISAMSLMSAYSSTGIPMLIFVIGSYIVGGLPMIQIGTRNSLKAINARTLMESSEILGASKTKSFFKVILPNITSGIVASSLFRFATLFGEFGILNLLVGGSFSNIQMFLRQNMNRNGYYTSAIVVSYFVIVTIMTIIGLNLSDKVTRKKGENV